MKNKEVKISDELHDKFIYAEYQLEKRIKAIDELDKN